MKNIKNDQIYTKTTQLLKLKIKIKTKIKKINDSKAATVTEPVLLL